MASTAREVARRALRRVRRDEAFLALALDGELRAVDLDPRERRLATELAYGTCRHQARLDRALAALTRRPLGKVHPDLLIVLRVAAYQLLFLDRVPAHAAVSEAVNAARKLGGSKLAGLANGVLRRLAREGEPALPDRSQVRAHLEAACSLPGWIVDRLASALGDGDELLAAGLALAQPARLAIRAAPATSGLADRLAADHPGAEIHASAICPGGLLVSGLGDPERSPSFAAGAWTVQDIGAQLVGHFLALPAPLLGTDIRPERHERHERHEREGHGGDAGRLTVLDACAGAGGKATHLAELYGDAIRIDAIDTSPRKLAMLGETAARLGVAGRITCKVADATHASGLYDAVLLDAPCTGLGVMRRHPETKWRTGEGDIARMAAMQDRLLDAVSELVRPGGILLYSVCTFTREEGRDRIVAFLARHPELALAPPGASPGKERGGAGAAIPWAELCPEPGILALWPHRHDADAFFAARMTRQAQNQ